MAYVLLPDIFQQHLTVNNTLAVGYVLKSYIYNTTTPSALYTNAAGSSSATSFTLNTRGAPSLGGNEVSLYGDTEQTAGYKIVLEDSVGGVIRTWEGPVFPPVSGAWNTTDIDGYADSMSSLISGSWAGYTKVNVASFHGGWAATTAGPKGRSLWHHDGTTGGTPTTNTTTAIQNAMATGKVISADGRGWVLDAQQKITLDMFGCKGDNSTDNTNGFVAAEAYTSGDDPIPLYIPVGQYKFTSLSITGRCVWIGENEYSSHLISTTTSASTDAISAVGTLGAEIVWSEFSHFRLSGSGLNRHGFYTNYCGRFTFTHVWAYGHGVAGFYYNNAWAGKFINCRSSGNGSDGLVCVDGTHWNNGTRVISGAYTDNGGDGIRLISTLTTDKREGMVIDGVGCTNNTGAGIRILGSAWEVRNHFLEYNPSGQIVIGSASYAATAGVIGPGSLDGGDPDAAYAATYQGIVILNGQHIKIGPQVAGRCTQAVWVDDSTSYDIQVVSGNKLSSTTGNWLTYGASSVSGANQDIHITEDAAGSIVIGDAPRYTYNMFNNTSGVRVNVTNNGSAAQTLWRWQAAGTTVFGLRNDGGLMTNNASAASAVSNVDYTIPIYDTAGTLLGYIPIYGTSTP